MAFKIPKGAWFHAKRNLVLARRIVGGKPSIGSIARWGATGAGIGALYGAGSSMMGRDDSPGLIGGAIKGGMMFGGGRALMLGARGLLGKGLGGARSAVGAGYSGISRSGFMGYTPKGGRSWRQGRGII